MNSKSIGADFVYAWPDAKVGMMDADLAVKIMYADASADELAEKAKEYDALQGSVMTAARRGYVDLIVDPADTRKYHGVCADPIREVIKYVSGSAPD